MCRFAILFFKLILSCTLAGICITAPSLAVGENWPGWRGPRGDGTSLEKGVPTEWNGITGKNIIWKTSVPGRGYASPIVW